MKIHFYERDIRRNDPDFAETCGSFSVIQNIIRKGLIELECYTEDPEKADYVGIADSLALDFKFNDKKSFIICFIDNINTISHLQYQLFHANKDVKLFSINQHAADIYAKYDICCPPIGPGIDRDFWYPTKPKCSKFTFFHNGFSNHRSGLELLIESFAAAFRGNNNVRLIIKDTSQKKHLQDFISIYKEQGLDISYINKRITFTEMRDLYSKSHVFCSIFRHSGHGIGIGEAGLCNCLVLAGDFDPSNKITQHGILLKPDKEQEIARLTPHLGRYFGLTDTFGNLSYFEEPRFYGYDTKEYSALLGRIYSDWDLKYSKINNRENILKVWDYKKSAANLVSFLTND